MWVTKGALHQNQVVQAKSLKKEEERSPILIGYFVSPSCLTIDLLTKRYKALLHWRLKFFRKAITPTAANAPDAVAAGKP
jgi:hypothetical protein